MIGKAESYYRILFESISDGVIVYDRDCNVLDANQIFAARFGRTRAAFIGINAYELFPREKYGDLFEQRCKKLREAFDTGETIVFEDSRDDRWFSNRFYPICDSNRVVAVALVSAEITDRIQSSKLMQEKLVLEKEAELLRQSNKNKNEFIYELAHELRNPLSTALSGVMLYKLQNGEKLNHTIAIIEKGLKQISNLVDDLLDITRITQNKIVLDKKKINLGSVVSSAADNFKTLYNAKNLNLNLVIDNADLYIEADLKRLNQILSNLLSNALKFSFDGGNVLLGVGKNKNTAVIRIRDDGIGINPDDIQRIFDPFFQDSNTLKKTSEGLGIGLYIVKGLTELHGGSVAVASEGAGKGAEFTVSMPLAD